MGGSDSAKGCVLVSPLLKPQKLKAGKAFPTVIKFSSGDKGSALLEGFGVTPSSLGIPGMRYIENSAASNKSTMEKRPSQIFPQALSHRFSTHVSGKRRQFSKETVLHSRT
ncbi:hypothetical protein AVEN_90041-1 [Araneus ventricosus]|uniref:Uncharacterized protein n=1 Tax=Araneus ventricosus TaxID=182803 RepID=A0A4Y2QYH2_ARAVE|nr:hypothetical protein AVEN_90041-1 [Araneus ventricosus]